MAENSSNKDSRDGSQSRDLGKDKSALDILLDRFNKVEENLLERFKLVETRMDNYEKKQDEEYSDSCHSDGESLSRSERVSGVSKHTHARGSRWYKSARGRNDRAETDASVRGRNDRTERDEEEFSVRDGEETDLARGEDEEDDLSVSDFCIDLGDKPSTSKTQALNALENDLEIVVKDGEKVDDKLAKVVNNRFSIKLPKEKLEKKMVDHKIPENCRIIKPPMLDEALTEKGLVDKNARKDDNRLTDIQSLIATATAALVSQTDELNTKVLDSNDPNEINMANKVIKTNGDIFAILGLAQQELTQRRRFEIGKVLPREVASITNAQVQTGSDTLFGDDIERLMRNARDNYRANRGGKHFVVQKRRGQRYHPYGQSSNVQRYYNHSKSPFLGKNTSFSGRGTYNNRGSAPRRGGFRK